MSILTVSEIHDGRDGSVDAVGGEISYTRVFRVITDSNYDEAAAVLADPRLPAVGSVYPFDPQCWLQKIAPRNESYSKKFWIVTCTYATTKEGDGGTLGGGDHDNPLLEWPKIGFASEGYEYAVFKDRHGTAILNTAGDPFNPPVMIEQYRQVWTIKKNISHPDYAGWNALGTLNDAAVTFQGNQGGISAQMGLCKSIQCSDWQVRNKIYYYTVTIVIVGPKRHGDGTFSHEVETLNAGMHQLERLKDANGDLIFGTETVVDCKDGTGEPTKHPALLDNGGIQIDGRFEAPWLIMWACRPHATWSGLVPGIV
jgi:hypothetical protein